MHQLLIVVTLRSESRRDGWVGERMALLLFTLYTCVLFKYFAKWMNYVIIKKYKKRLSYKDYWTDQLNIF